MAGKRELEPLGKSSQAVDDAVDEDRRAALARLGRYGAYTAPALLALMIGSKTAEAASTF